MGVQSFLAAFTRVLVVEDCEMNRILVRSLLMKLGCEVTLACDGHEACALAATQAFDIIFMDCEMPAMDGFEATEEIRRRELGTSARRVPIVALTASSEPNDRERCIAAGMDDFVSKPFRREGLREAVQRHASPTRVI